MSGGLPACHAGEPKKIIDFVRHVVTGNYYRPATWSCKRATLRRVESG